MINIFMQQTITKINERRKKEKKQDASYMNVLF